MTTSTDIFEAASWASPVAVKRFPKVPAADSASRFEMPKAWAEEAAKASMSVRAAPKTTPTLLPASATSEDMSRAFLAKVSRAPVPTTFVRLEAIEPKLFEADFVVWSVCCSASFSDLT